MEAGRLRAGSRREARAIGIGGLEKLAKRAASGVLNAREAMNRDNAVWDIASIYAVQSVIRPEETRDYLIRMLEVHRLRLTNGVGRHLMRAWPTSF